MTSDILVNVVESITNFVNYILWGQSSNDLNIGIGWVPLIISLCGITYYFLNEAPNFTVNNNNNNNCECQMYTRSHILKNNSNAPIGSIHDENLNDPNELVNSIPINTGDSFTDTNIINTNINNNSISQSTNPAILHDFILPVSIDQCSGNCGNTLLKASILFIGGILNGSLKKEYFGITKPITGNNNHNFTEIWHSLLLLFNNNKKQEWLADIMSMILTLKSSLVDGDEFEVFMKGRWGNESWWQSIEILRQKAMDANRINKVKKWLRCMFGDFMDQLVNEEEFEQSDFNGDDDDNVAVIETTTKTTITNDVNILSKHEHSIKIASWLSVASDNNDNSNENGARATMANNNDDNRFFNRLFRFILMFTISTCKNDNNKPKQKWQDFRQMFIDHSGQDMDCEELVETMNLLMPSCDINDCSMLTLLKIVFIFFIKIENNPFCDINIIINCINDSYCETIDSLIGKFSLISKDVANLKRNTIARYNSTKNAIGNTNKKISTKDEIAANILRTIEPVYQAISASIKNGDTCKYRKIHSLLKSLIKQEKKLGKKLPNYAFCGLANVISKDVNNNNNNRFKSTLDHLFENETKDGNNNNNNCECMEGRPNNSYESHCMTNNRYLSASRQLNVAKHFAESEGDTRNTILKMDLTNIHLKSNIDCADIGHLSVFPNEEEILFGPMTIDFIAKENLNDKTTIYTVEPKTIQSIEKLLKI